MEKESLISLREALKPRKRGPKFKGNPEDREIEKLRRKVEKLEGFLKEKDEKIKELRERLNPAKEEFKPVKCPYCGFEKVYRNLTIKGRGKGSLIN